MTAGSGRQAQLYTPIVGQIVGHGDVVGKIQQMKVNDDARVLKKETEKVPFTRYADILYVESLVA